MILRPTQILIEKIEWSSKKDKFLSYLELKGSYSDHTLIDGVKNRISRISEMNFYDNGAEYISGNSIVFMEYEYLESVFETENYFVVMVQNRDIFHF